MNKKVIVTLILLSIWLGVIIYSSSQPYSDQDIQPLLQNWNLEWVYSLLGSISFTYGGSEISVIARGPAAFIEFFIRKGAHLLVFSILGFLLTRIFLALNYKVPTAIMLTLMIIFPFACIDEYRHLLHPDRTGLFADVILDTIGGVIGVLSYLIVRRYKKRSSD
ncbi:VanZ family protein [Alkalihalophilus pseudofirmus]|uniref:VanZ family protein n=1 Tax=Alkalihalophilus pseudofirmus TaxID=79885 RepID=UPI00259B2E4D|nr:VanZ family protein [Alkalihalophilus pseudofirmus]WEG16638.1 VanZ family protein [Alkalihalophilus pseudofirmus]